MRKMMKYGKLFAVSAAALGMTAALTLEGAGAYFTTYVSAGGSQVVRLGGETTIHEDLDRMTKHITIANASMEHDCFVRVKVFYAGDFTMEYTDVAGNGDWYQGEEDYWYYRPVLPATTDPAAPSMTTGLDVKIIVPEDFDRDSFNVVVIQECTPVVYDEDGNAAADWNTVISGYEEFVEGEGGGNE